METSHLSYSHSSQDGLAHLYADTKHILVLVDNNRSHRAEARTALISLYNIVEFEEPLQASEYMRIVQPGALLIADHGSLGLEFIAALRKEPRYATLPILLMFEQNDPDAITSAKAAGASGWLFKPYQCSVLIKLVSGSLNASIEAQWENLPPLQAKALNGTMDWFNGLSDGFQKGNPIIYADVNNVCSPLVDAIHLDDYKGILRGIRNHDNYTYAHSLRAAVFLTLFGRAMGLSKVDQNMLTTGGLLYDIGKLFVPHLVLNKPGQLTGEEFEVMKGHVNASVKVLKAGKDIPKEVIAIASQHHEKLDGTGYPRGLKGTELNELARMAAIVDIFSALTARRVYKSPVPPEVALRIMADEMAHHLDVGLFSRFREMLHDTAVEI